MQFTFPDSPKLKQKY